jgi:hypothetical protein
MCRFVIRRLISPVTERAEPPLQALIMMSISMILSLILDGQRARRGEDMANILAASALHDEHILITDRGFFTASVSATSLELSDQETRVLISTDVSPLLNFFRSALDGFWPSRSQIASTRCGWEDPEKMQTDRMVKTLFKGGSL